MKQHITLDQLNELSREAKSILHTWWTPRPGDLYKRYGGVHVSTNKTVKAESAGNGKTRKIYPLLSIGQMIEFLDEHNRGHEGTNILPFVKEFNEECKYIEVKPVSEWCDALWEVVKEVLEK